MEYTGYEKFMAEQNLTYWPTSIELHLEWYR
jgi:hypothetical protein